MADTDKKVTFELKDLTYEELVNSYLEVCEFLTFLDDAKVAVKGDTDEEGEEGEENAENSSEESTEETGES